MNILIAGNYGASNIGDEMILAGLLTSLRSTFLGAKLTVLSANPKETAKTHSVNSLPLFPAGVRSHLRAIFDKRNKKALKEADYFFLGGGGLFNDLSKRANYIWFQQANQAIKQNIPLVMIGQSVGPIKNDNTCKTLKETFSKAQLIAVRDHSSLKFLNSIGITQQVHVIPDFAFRIPAKSKPSAAKNILVSLRQNHKITPQKLQAIADFLNSLKSEEYKVNIVEFQHQGHENDSEISKKLLSKLKITATHLTPPKSLEELEEIYNNSSFVLGMRLHSVINAIRMNKPFLAISYASKVDDFLQSAGFTNSVSLENCTADLLETTFRKISSQNLQEKEEQYNSQTKDIFENFEATILSKLSKKQN